jgi:hypothetical protein
VRLSGLSGWGEMGVSTRPLNSMNSVTGWTRQSTPGFMCARRGFGIARGLPVHVGERRSATLRRIVREELERRGVGDAVVKPSPESLEAAGADGEREDDCPDWVRVRDELPVGFPGVLRPNVAKILHMSAGRFSGMNVIGDRHDGSWCASVIGVDDREPVDLVPELLAGLVSAGCTVRIEPTVVEHPPMCHVAAARFRGLGVVVTGFMLRGRRDKPSYLKRRAERTAIAVDVIHRAGTGRMSHVE